jgi:hypothetical protein
MPSHPPLLPFLLSSFPSAASELRRPPLLLVLKTEMLTPPSSSLPRCAAAAYDRIRLASEHAGGRRHLPWMPTSRSASTQDDGSCGYKGDDLNMLDFSSAFPLLPPGKRALGRPDRLHRPCFAGQPDTESGP